MPTLRPPQPVTETVAELSISGDLLCLKFAAKNEAFRQLAREMRFRWNETLWRRERKITAQTGTAEDRLIEAAYKLLATGFIVSVPDGIDDSLQRSRPTMAMSPSPQVAAAKHGSTTFTSGGGNFTPPRS